MLTPERIDDLESDAISRAFLYPDPASFREGVETVMTAVRAELARRERAEPAPRSA